eukprot:GHVT01095411.1.p1 GENE.GHVT01095411.1~~GHVT01095411.1.p1  ORF type:complete len:193 (+),score=13.04 GHVT01095411.1:591-1169(+)
MLFAMHHSLVPLAWSRRRASWALPCLCCAALALSFHGSSRHSTAAATLLVASQFGQRQSELHPLTNGVYDWALAPGDIPPATSFASPPGVLSFAVAPVQRSRFIRRLTDVTRKSIGGRMTNRSSAGEALPSETRRTMATSAPKTVERGDGSGGEGLVFNPPKVFISTHSRFSTVRIMSEVNESPLCHRLKVY